MIIGIVLAITIATPIIFRVTTAEAFGPTVVIGDVVTSAKWVWEKINVGYDKIRGIVGARLADQTLSMFVNTLSYDIATELATGGPGGRPSFRTLSIGKSLEKAQEAAIGEFIGVLTKESFADLGLNLCDPSVGVKLSLTLSLIDSEAPRPTCNWREVQRNWEQFGDSLSNDLIKFQLDPRRGADSFSQFFDSFSVEQSDLGAYQVIQEELERRKEEQKLIEQIRASECSGFLDKATTISGEVKTHCSQLLKISEAQWDAAVQASIIQQNEKKYAATTGKLSDILKDAALNFRNTFASKLMTRWIKGGSWSLADILGQDGRQNFRDELLAILRGGDVTRQRNLDIFQDFKSIEITKIEDFNILEDYVLCPENREYRTPDNCTMSEDLFTAISGRKTVQQAITEGIINGALPLIGPQDAERNGSDNCYRDGLCYSNLVKMRKANIIPIGWELATRRSPVTSPVKLQEVIDCFEDDTQHCKYAASDQYAVNGVPHNPYYHLIDPDWVLKASPAICDALVNSAVIESPDSQNRQQYCADPKVCLREDDQGNCLEGQYGYCTRSENIWRLQGDICTDGEIYSGCLTFTNDDFGKNSYLEGSLDYCTADQVGCRRYSTEKTAAGTFVFQDITTDDDDIYLNGRTQDCSDSDAGCDQYIVASTPSNTNFGPNIFANGDFEMDRNGDNIPDGFENITFGPNREFLVNDPECQFGRNCVKVVSSAVDTWWGVVRIFEVTPGSYNLSAYVRTDGTNDNQAYVHMKDCGSDPTCSGGSWLTSFGSDTTDWTRVSRTETFGPDTRYITAYVGLHDLPAGQTAWVDNIQLQMVGNQNIGAGSYRAYGEGGTVYMNDNTVMCSYDEVGCQGYTPASGDPMIPAVISQADLCPAECVGYSTFAEQPTVFDLIEGDNAVEYYNFIPDTARSCSQGAVGCEQFTNLDEVAQGGEGIEYYTYVRQCVQETHPDAQTYFTWEGSDTAGYQIRTWYALKSNISDAPCTGVDPSATFCTERLGSAWRCGVETSDPNDDPDVNPDCRQFFDEAGTSYWRLQSKVILASPDCHPLRRTESGEVLSGIPSLSNECNASENGCREYVGNTGNNIRNLFNDSFESGTYSPWTAATIDLSNESLQNNGHSLKVRTGQDNFRPVTQLAAYHDYKLSFWMKSNVFVDNLDIKIQGTYLAGGTGTLQFNDPASAQFTDIEAGNWHLYTLTKTLPSDVLGYDVSSFRFLFRVNGAAGDVFFDNVQLQEVNSSITVIKNSWNTPISCNSPFTGYHLGCQAYTDTNGVAFNLKSFSRLCREEAIGCSLVIDTHNSSYPFEETFNTGDYSEITVPADSVTYLVPDSDNYCPSIYKGCMELGVEDPTDPGTIIEVTKINDPDQYGQILCDHDGLNCESFGSDKGQYYFKHPGLFTCTYQENLLIGAESWNGWFKTENIDTSPEGCSDDGDGILESTDFEQRVGYASLCPASKNLCTGFVDATDPGFYNLGCKVGTVDPETDGICSNVAFITRTSCLAAGLGWEEQPECKTYYYYNNDKIDESSCGGQVDRSGGCVLLYDENDWNADHSSVNAAYDTQLTYDSAVSLGRPVSPAPCNPSTPGSVCDANKLIKVQSDRQCAEWLTCKSSTAVWDPDTNQYRILCDEIDSCIEYSNENNITKCSVFDSYTEDVVPLTIQTYQERASGTNNHLEWSDKEYTGFSVPNLLPIKDLDIYTFGSTAQSSVTRLVYPVTNSTNPAGAGVYTPTCYAGGVNIEGVRCEAIIDGSTFTGECGDGICWVQPEAGQTSTSTYAMETRGYAAPEAPYPQAISSNFGQTQIEDRSPAYRGANICQLGDDRCEYSYTKNTYSLGGEALYFPTDVPAPLAICVQGQTRDESTGLPVDCWDGAKANNSLCDTDKNPGNPSRDGICAVKTRQETFLNWTGICLEKDINARLPFDRGSDNFCNQWFGVDKISGASSLYDNYQQAGYYDVEGEENLFCAVTNAFRTTEERVYCGKSVSVDSENYCSVLIRVPAVTKVNAASMENHSAAINGGFILAGTGAGKYKYHGANDPAPQTYYNNGNPTTAGFGAAWIERGVQPIAQSECTSQPQWANCGCTETQVPLEGTSFFPMLDFNNQVIAFDQAASVFDTSASGGQIEYFFYDEEIGPDGNLQPETGIMVPVADQDYGTTWIVGVGHKWGRYDSDASPACIQDLEGCDGNTHETYWMSPLGAGAGGDRARGCNPLPYNYYIRADQGRWYSDDNGWKSCDPPRYANTCNIVPQAANVGTPCSGLGCWQQCDLVTQLDPLGERSFVKTDIWWRSKDPGTSRIAGQTWDSYYYLSGTGYTLNANVNFANITGQTTSFTNFGSAQSRIFPNTKILTAAPLPGSLIGENAATFYGAYNTAGSWVISGAVNRLANILARAYNLRFDAPTRSYVPTGSITNYIFTGRQDIYPSYGANVNPFAGPDYAPYILRVCVDDSGVGTCDLPGGGAETGITINNINNGNIIGHKQLFVATKFYYHAHPDHMPIYDVAIDWDDGRSFISTPGRYKNSLPLCRSDAAMPGPGSGLQGFGGQDVACRQGYKVFYNIYYYDTAFACDGTGGRPSIANASCYQPQVRVTDNWGNQKQYPSGPALANSISTEVYPDWIVVYNE